MTLAHAIAKSLDTAELCKTISARSDAYPEERILFIERAAAIEHLCAVARQHLAPESVEQIAQAMLDRAPAQVSGMITIKKGDA
jgi:ABC-type phosphate/phosphonate transport system substrate-binding protein